MLFFLNIYNISIYFKIKIVNGFELELDQPTIDTTRNVLAAG